MDGMSFARSLVLRNRAISALLVAAAMSAGRGAAGPRGGREASPGWIASLWPEAQAAGVSRGTFDAGDSGLEPDYKLPDLILPGRPSTGAPSQAEFVQVPAAYVRETTIARLAAEGQRLMQKHRAPRRDRNQFGVPGPVVLAIWGRETDFRPLHAAPRRAPRAGDAGLGRPSQGPVSRGSSCLR